MEPNEYFRLAAVEDRMWYAQALRAHLMDAARHGGVTCDANMLDAGCGTGGLLRYVSVARADWRCVGIDIDANACAWSRKRVPGYKIEQASVNKLPFESDCFELVVSSDVLYALDEDAGAVAEMYRVLKPGGLLLVNVPAHPWLWSYHDEAVHGRRRYERRGLKKLLADAGFEVKRITHWNLLLLPALILRRKVIPPRTPVGSDVGMLPAPLELIFKTVSRVERVCMRMGINMPVGSSLLASARKL